jgi:hypothetical protein
VDGFDGTVEKSAAGGLISVAGPRVLPVELDPDSPVLPLPAAGEGDTLERVGAAVAVEEVADLPSMAQSGVSTPGCDCGHEGMAAGWHPNTCRWIMLRISDGRHDRPLWVTEADVDVALAGLASIEALRDEAFRIRDEVRASAERPPASPGWLGRLLHRLFGRTT